MIEPAKPVRAPVRNVVRAWSAKVLSYDPSLEWANGQRRAFAKLSCGHVRKFGKMEKHRANAMVARLNNKGKTRCFDCRKER